MLKFRVLIILYIRMFIILPTKRIARFGQPVLSRTYKAGNSKFGQSEAVTLTSDDKAELIRETLGAYAFKTTVKPDLY